jgi:hypothetical protein
MKTTISLPICNLFHLWFSHSRLQLSHGLVIGDKGEAGEKGRTGDFGFPGPQVIPSYLLYYYLLLKTWAD